MSSTHRYSGAMQDGRFATSYAPVCKLNAELRTMSGAPAWNNTEYRAYLQKHGLAALHRMYEQHPCGPSRCADLGMAFKGTPKPQVAPLSLTDAPVMPYEGPAIGSAPSPR